MHTNFVSAVKYYASSIPTLLSGLDFWRVPILLILRPIRLITNGGLRFYVGSIMDVWLLKEVLLDRQYEQRKGIRPGDTVIDIGAGIGDFAVLASKKALRVFSYEQDSKKAGLVRKNIRLNNCQNVHFSHSEVRSLDQIFKENGIEWCDFLKIDCEGCEYAIFAGASEGTLSRIEHIAMEVHLFTPQMEQQYANLKDCLIRNRFEIKELPNPVHRSLRLVFADRE